MWLILIFVIIILKLLAYFDTIKPKNFPPGPKWLPILGSAWTIHKFRKNNRTYCKAAAKMTQIYGPILGLRLGKDRTVIVHGVEAIREFLTKEELSGRPRGIFYKIRTWGKRRGVLLTDEEFWKEQRRFVLRHLREFGFGKSNMSGLIEEEALMMVNNIKEEIENNHGSLEVKIDDMFGIPVLNTLWTMMAGARYSPEDKEIKRLQKILTNLLANIDVGGTLFSHFPILRHIAPKFSGYELYVEAHSRIWDFLNEELDKHKKSYNPDHIRDFMDVYLKMLNSPEKPDSFSECQLLAICLDFFIAGSDTTTKTLEFAFLFLVLNPDIAQKVQEEIDAVVGKKRLPTLSDRSNMPYTECVVLESLRMFGGRIFTLPHRALCDTTLGGYFIPKDTMVLANLHGILMGDQSGWADPAIFDPERYLMDGQICTPLTYLPFGLGRHRCIGETLSKANVFLIISSLLQTFDFKHPPGSPLPSTETLDGVTPGPQPFKAIVTLRK